MILRKFLGLKNQKKKKKKKKKKERKLRNGKMAYKNP